MIQLNALKKRPERHAHRQTNKQTNKQKLTCRSSANFVSAGHKLTKEDTITFTYISKATITVMNTTTITWISKATITIKAIIICISTKTIKEIDKTMILCISRSTLTGIITASISTSFIRKYWPTKSLGSQEWPRYQLQVVCKRC